VTGASQQREQKLKEQERNLMAIALGGGIEAAAQIVLDLDESDLIEANGRWLLAELARRIGRGHAYHDLIATANDDQAAYLDDLNQRYVTAATAPQLLAAVKGESRRKQARLTLGRALERISAGDDEAINDALGELARIITPSKTHRVHTAAEVLQSALLRLKALRSGEIKACLPLGLPATEKALAIQPGQLVVIGGRTGTGKTALATSMTWEIAFRRRTPLLYLNSEMDKSEIGLRIAAVGASLHLGRIRVAPTAEDEAVIRRLADSQGGAPALVTQPLGSLTSNDVVALTRYHHAVNQTQVVVVDYIQRLRDWVARRDVSQWQMLMEITSTLKSLATDLGIIVIALAQLNSAGELQASKGMANDADLVLALEACADDNEPDSKRREGPEKTKPGQTHLLWVQKGRHVPGDLRAALAMDPVTLQFREVV
jgi:replicative DNA helicase